MFRRGIRAQISLRAKRLGIHGGGIYLLTETNVEKILSHAKKLGPDIIIVDSIQTMYHSESNTVPGSITQIRECAGVFINKAKSDGTSVILVDTSTKKAALPDQKCLSTW